MREDNKVDPLEALQEAQLELAALQRQFRFSRNCKKVYVTQTQNTIRRQKDAIQVLLQEKKHLVTLNNVAGRLWNQCCDQNNLNIIHKLLDKEQVVHDEINQEKTLIAQVEKGETELERKIAQQQNTMKGNKDVNQTKNSTAEKQIRVLKNRLDNTSKKFNSAMAGNQKLRENIDHVQRQQERFQELCQRLDNRLAKVKAEIEKTSETATAHFDARDEAQHRMASLRERRERDLTMFNIEIKDVMRVIEHGRRLRDFMDTKAEDRTTILEEETRARELKKLSIHLHGLKVEVQKYEDIFEKIKEATGINDTDTLVDSFIEKQDSNFALFNYVTAMSIELENLQDVIQNLNKEKQKIMDEDTTFDVRRKEILRELQSQLKSVTTQLSISRRRSNTTRSTLEKAKANIEKLFKKIKCDRSAISELLGGGTCIDDYNAMQYLGIIEQKCNELLQIKALLRLRITSDLDQNDAQILESLQGIGPQPGPAVVSIAPPSIEDDRDVMLQASDTKPLTEEEVQLLFTDAALQGGPSKVGGAPTAKPSKKKSS